MTGALCSDELMLGSPDVDGSLKTEAMLIKHDRI